MTMEDFVLTLTDEFDPGAEAVIENGLGKYNENIAGCRDSRPLGVFVFDPRSKTVIGGLHGRTSLGLFFVDLFFLPESVRGHGIGSRIMETAEAEAKNRGCSAAVLYTITFQAPGFYERCGYRVLGRIEVEPPGHTRFCMTKRL
ncbi:MAG TPA: GNAT family N-acetyltransferase [Pseudomonadota bacterium]|nr:GNAT family N-acetyltransferase [Pseudomonadota bacterium]